VVVLGAGIAGATFAKKLIYQTTQRQCDITVIDLRFVHVMKCAAARAVALGERFAYRVAIPNQELVPPSRGQVIHKKVDKILTDRNTVVLEDGGVIPYDILICATGAVNKSVCEPTLKLRTTRDVVKWYKHWHEQIQKNKNIAILGAGVVGTELAAEIKYHNPDKIVSLISNDQVLIDGGSPAVLPGFNKKLKLKLDKLGVRIYLGQKPTNLTEKDFKGRCYLDTATTIKTSKGNRIEADLVLLCNGKTLNNKMYPPEWLNGLGQLVVCDTLQLNVNPNVFAIGDVNSANVNKQAYTAIKQADLAAKNVKSLIQSKQMKSYSPPSFTYLSLPTGRDTGVTQYGPVVLGDRITRIWKGEELEVSRRWKLYNQGNNLIRENEENWVLISDRMYPASAGASMKYSASPSNPYEKSSSPYGSDTGSKYKKGGRYPNGKNGSDMNHYMDYDARYGPPALYYR